MFADQLTKKHQKNLLTFALIQSLPSLAFITVLIGFRDYLDIAVTIYLAILFGCTICLIILINYYNRKMYKKIYKIDSLDHKIPYPTSFKKQQRTLLIDGKKGYTINKHVIPARFVEFVEGKRAYLIKELEDVHEVNEYRILFIHKHRYGLIEDVDRKKYIIHLNNLEQVS